MADLSYQSSTTFNQYLDCGCILEYLWLGDAATQSKPICFPYHSGHNGQCKIRDFNSDAIFPNGLNVVKNRDCSDRLFPWYIVIYDDSVPFEIQGHHFCTFSRDYVW